MPGILIIEDDETLLQSLVMVLDFSKFTTYQARTGHEGLLHYRKHDPDIIILDLGLPDMDGLQVLKEIRKTNKLVNVIIITGKNSDYNQLSAFKLSADDFLAKPFNLEIFLARVKNIMEHERKITGLKVQIFNHLYIDYESKIIMVNSQIVEMTPLEFRILSLLTLNAGKLLDYDFILTRLWNDNYNGDKESLKNEIKRIRKKIEVNPKKPKLITCKYGVGYRFNPVN